MFDRIAGHGTPTPWFSCQGYLFGMWMGRKVNAIFDHDQMVARILDKYNGATDSDKANSVWYKAAHTFALGLARKHHVTIEHAASIIAILSPRLEWGLNMRYAELWFETGNCPTFYSTKVKLARIDAGDRLADVQNGRKVASFYDNIVRPGRSLKVTVDRHAYDIATGSDDDSSRRILNRKGAYDAVEAAYVEAAEIVGLRPCELQAVVWVAHKRTKEYGPKHAQFARKGAVA